MIEYRYASRDGSNWLAPGPGGVGLVPISDPASQLGPNAIYIPTMADRDRSKLRFLLTWNATDAMTLQFTADVGRDTYNAPTQYALQGTNFDLYSIDMNYALTDAWNMTAYVSKGSQTLNQSRPLGYVLSFNDDALNAGIGVNGKFSEKLKMGGLLSYISNLDKYSQAIGPTTSAGNAALLAVSGGLPDVVYRRIDLRVYGSYEMSAKSTVRFDAGYQRLTYEDWGYGYNGTPFLYSDNSTVFIQPNQNVGYLGLSYIYTWR
jgi:hypothetical protein